VFHRSSSLLPESEPGRQARCCETVSLPCAESTEVAADRPRYERGPTKRTLRCDRRGTWPPPAFRACVALPRFVFIARAVSRCNSNLDRPRSKRSLAELDRRGPLPSEPANYGTALPALQGTVAPGAGRGRPRPRANILAALADPPEGLAELRGVVMKRARARQRTRLDP